MLLPISYQMSKLEIEFHMIHMMYVAKEKFTPNQNLFYPTHPNKKVRPHQSIFLIQGTPLHKKQQHAHDRVAYSACTILPLPHFFFIHREMVSGPEKKHFFERKKVNFTINPYHFEKTFY